MKKFFGFILGISLFAFFSCSNGSSYTIRRIKSNLDLKYNEKTQDYEYIWYLFKYLTDNTDEINAGATIYFKLNGVPHQNIPQIYAYFAELRDPNLNSRAEYEATKEEGSEYVATTAEWVQLTPAFPLFYSAAGGVEFELEQNLIFEYDVLDNTKTGMIFFLNPAELSEDYFAYYEELLIQAEETAQKIAEEKAAKMNSKYKLTEEDENYHTAEEYYQSFYQDELDKIGEKRVIINDVTFRMEVVNP